MGYMGVVVCYDGMMWWGGMKGVLYSAVNKDVGSWEDAFTVSANRLLIQ